MAKKLSKVIRQRRRRFQIEALESRRLLAAELDYGDAPDLGPGYGPGNYSTLPEDNGPSHEVSPALFIGTQPGQEATSLPNDGIRSPGLDLSFTVTSSPTVTVLVNNTTGKAATLYGWVDFNGDGVFDDASERASAAVVSPPTDDNQDPSPEDGFFINQAVELRFPQLLTSFYGETYARFRLGLTEDDAAASSTGEAGTGEVEDYVAQIHRPSTGIAEELQPYQTDALYGIDRNKFTTPFVSDQYSFDYRLGSSIVSIGDLNEDGIEDMAVGVPGANMDGPSTGAVHIFFMDGNGSYEKRTIIGPDSGFGTLVDYGGNYLRLASLGDLDGDGINELAISHGYRHADTSLHALFLNRDGTARKVKPIDAGVGFPVGALGDLDADGTHELAFKDAFERESFQILSFNSQAEVVATSNIFNAEAGGETPDENDLFGMAVEPVGDLDDNGTVDLAVGVRLGGSYDAGQVQVLFLDRTDSAFAVTQRTEFMRSNVDASTSFGNAISAIGDLDGDGVTELVIGDPSLRTVSYPDGEPTDEVVGAAYLVYLNSTGTVKRFGQGSFGIDSPISRSEYYGTSIELLGDPADDGTITFAIGAPGYANSGLVDVRTIKPDESGPRLGLIGPFGTKGQASKVVASLGDIDGNGYQDMAVSEGNSVQILLVGAEGRIIATEEITGPDSGIGSFGTDASLSSAGDIDGDGIEELAVGTPTFNGISRFSDDVNGVVRILYLNSDGSLRKFSEIHPTPSIGPDDDNEDPGYLKFGKAITSPGDLDGNGVPDLLVSQNGFWRRRLVTSETDGQYYVTDNYPAYIDVLLMEADGTARRGKRIEGKTGTDLTSIGDLNGDGYPDVVLGNNYSLDVLLLGEDGSLINSVPYSFPTDGEYSFGQSVDYLGDVDADGMPDLLVGGARPYEIGSTEIISLNSNGTVMERLELTFQSRNSWLYRGQGRDYASLGDVNGDGVVDFAMASPPRNREYVPEGGLLVIALKERPLGDFGDAPDVGTGTGAFNYQTNADDSGPIHFVNPRLRLGELITDDIDVKPNTEANQDDDDGVVDPSELHITGDTVIHLSVTNDTTQDAMLYGWIDANFDGTFDATERVSESVPADSIDQVTALPFPDLPAGVSGTTYARFRLSTDDAAASMPTGPAPDGEVEDYLVTIDTPPIFLGADDSKPIVGMSGSYSSFGTAVAWLGDLDGNGVDDYAVGYRQRDKISILLMATDQVIGQQVDHTSTRFDRWDTFGGSVTSLGDLDGDGVTDIAVGASGTRGLTGEDTGAVYILFLNSDGTEKSRTVITDGTPGLLDLQDRFNFGASVAAIGDVNHDTVIDLAVGAPGPYNRGDGEVYILLLDTDGSVKSSSKIARNVGGGPNFYANFGGAVGGIGLWNDDDIPDLVVSSPQEHVLIDGVYQSDVGAVYVLTLNADGTASSATQIDTNAAGLSLSANDLFGSSLANLGDIDGDGVNDLAVGAVGDDTNGTNHGAVHLLLMNGDGTIKDMAMIADQFNGGPDLIDPANDRADFGSALATVPIEDENGLPVLPVLAIGADQARPRGQVYLTHLTEEFLDFGDAPLLADAEIVSSQTDVFDLQLQIDGLEISTYQPIGDINDDGVMDFGATYTEDFHDGVRPLQRHGIAVMLMNADGTVASVQPYAPDVYWGSFSGATPGRDIGDLDGDGITDITLSYRGHGTHGRVYLLYMNADGTVRDTAMITSTNVAGLPTYFKDTEYFGTSVTSLGDLNDDGTRDLAIGTTSPDSPGDVYVFLMNPDGTVQDWNIIGTGAGNSGGNLTANFGYSVANLGDFDGDGNDDLLVGAPQWSPTGLAGSGAAYVMFMNDVGGFHSFQRIDAASGLPLRENDRFGSAVTPIGDVDGDGITDIAVGATGDDDGGDNHGSVYVVLLNGDGTPKSWSLITNSIAGGPDTSNFGDALTVLGDTDNNGMMELLVGGSGGALAMNLAAGETDYPAATDDLPPSHSTTAEVFLGAAVDLEPRGWANAAADWDEVTGSINDADGLIDPTQLSSFIPGKTVIVDVLATNRTDEPATVYGWIDFNGNKHFDRNERASADVDPGSIGTVVSLAFPAPAPSTVIEDDTYARFRISTDVAASAPTGYADDGEVEDYSTSITIIDTDYGDAPDSYQTLSTNSGPSHVVNNTIYLGDNVDVELEAKVSTTARGDSDDGLVDAAEDLNLIPGQVPKVRVSVTNDTEGPARLLGWIDYFGDGVFGDDEKAFKEIDPGFSGMVELEFPSVPDQALGNTFARFRLSTDSTLTAPTGPATDGEVEDYRVTILANDYSDAGPSYQTASHYVVDGLSIGTSVDRELNAVPSPDANSDDFVGGDDEDGFDSSSAFLTPGEPPSVTVQVTKQAGVTASLYGWIDIDGNGFADDETVVQALDADSSGTFDVDLNWGQSVPEGTSGLRNIRFRISTDDLSGTPGGHASDGEVEDHQILIRNIDLGDAPDPGPGTATGNYRTRFEDGGPSHSIVPELYLGSAIDNESASNQFVTDENGDLVLDVNGDPIQRLSANGDDVTPVGGIDDEDGLFDAAEDLKLIVDEIPEVRLVATNETEQLATVHGWIDFNMDGDFVDEGEHSYKSIGPGQVNQTVTLEFDPLVTGEYLGTTYARFRITTDLALEPEMVKPTGHLSDGEVEDYVATMSSLNTDPLQLAELRINSADVLSGNAKANEFYGSSIASANTSGSSDIIVGVPGKAASTTFLSNADSPVGFREEVVIRSVSTGTSSVQRPTTNQYYYQGSGFGASLVSFPGSGIIAIGADNFGVSEGECTREGFGLGFGDFPDIDTPSIVCVEREWHPTRQGSVTAFLPLDDGDFISAKLWNNTSTTPTANPGDRYGASIANIGQVNADTDDDVAVGAPGYDANRGAVYILQREGVGISSYTPISSESSNLMPQLAEGAQFGTSVAAFSDNVIAVGTEEQGGRGSIYLLTLDSNGQLVTAPTRIGSGTAGLGSLAAGEEFGATVVAPGDLNGDGIDDLIVGSPDYGNLGALRILYLGPKDGDQYTVRSSEILTPAKLRKADSSMPTISSGDRFGHALSLHKAMDNEGRFEILVGPPKFGSNDAGGVFLLSLQSRLTPATLGDNILDLPDSEPGVESDIGSDSIDDWLGAVASLPEFPRPNELVTITLNILPSTSIGKDITVPSGYELVINSIDGPLTFTGASPAFTLRSGNVTVAGDVTFVNATDAPTILVAGGRLKLRGTHIDETTTSDRPAIEVRGGTVDLGTAMDPGNNTININGLGSLINHSGSTIFTAVGNTFQQDGIDIADGFVVEEAIEDYFENAASGAVLVYDDRYFDRTKVRVSDFDLQTLSADLGVTAPSFEILGNVAGTATLLPDNQTVRFTADSSGLSSFTFAVIEDNATQAIRTVQLDVTNIPPEVDLGADLIANEGDAIHFGGAYIDPGDDSVHTFAWTVKNESDQVIAEGNDQAFDFTPTDDGVYTVTYSVTDGLGETGSDQLILTASNVAPTPSIDSISDTRIEGTAIAVVGSANDPAGQNDTVGLAWRVIKTAADGTMTDSYATGTGADWSFTPDDNGAYRIELTASDEDGGSAAVSETIVVANVPPSLPDLQTELVENSAVGTPVASMNATDPGTDTVTYRILPGGPAAGFEIDANSGLVTVKDSTFLDYETATSLSLQIEASDEDGGSNVAELTIGLLNQPSLSGSVFVDVNEDGIYQANEPGIDDVEIRLTDLQGNPVLDPHGDAITAITSDGGFYLFEDLDPGEYQIAEQQPSGVTDGPESLGSLGGSLGVNDVMQLELARTDAYDYMFAEIGGGLSSGESAGIGFWQSKHGQELIAAGGTSLAGWLTNSFDNVFGNLLADASGQEVADFYRNQLFRGKAQKSSGPAKVDAQFMATAFNVYFTNSNLSGSLGSDYGFTVTDTGLGNRVVNVGSSGSAFDTVDGDSLTVMQLLSATNSLTDADHILDGFASIYDLNGDGILDGDEINLRMMANDLYAMINEQ